MQKIALPKVLVLIAFILVSIIAGLNVSFAHPLATKYVTVTAKNDPGGVVEITYTYGGVTYGPYNTTSVETIKIPSGATVTFTAIPLNGFGWYGWNYSFIPYSMITSSTQFTFSSSQSLTFSNVQTSITAIAFFPVKLSIVDPAIWDYITTSEGYYISFVGGVAFANNNSLVPPSLLSQNTFTLNVEVQAVGSSNVVSGSVSLIPSGSVLYRDNYWLFNIYDPNGLEMKYAYITWSSPKPWLYESGTIWSANDYAWGIAVNVKPGESTVLWALPFQNLNFQLTGQVLPSTSSENVYFPAGSSPSFYDTPNSGYAFLNWYMIESTNNTRTGNVYTSSSNPWTFYLPSNSFAQAYTGPYFTLEPNVVQTKVVFDVSAPAEAVGTKVSLTLTFPNGSSQTQTQTLVSATGSALATPGTSASFTWTSIPVGNYSWSISPTTITYSTPYGSENATAYPSSGSFTLSSTNNGTYTQGITYSSGVVNVTFTETGLASGLEWWVELGTVNESAIAPNPIIFYNVPARSTISYKVDSPILADNGWVKYQTSQASGSISTGITNVTQQISYSTYYLVNVIFNPDYATANPQTAWVQAGGSQTFELTPEEDYYIAQPYSSSITAPSGITINYNSITKTTSGNTYVYNVPVTVNAPGNITVSLTWFNFIDYISESGLPSGQSWSFVIYQNGQEQSSNTVVGSPVSIEEPGFDYATNSYYIYNITFPVIQAGSIYYVPTSISTSAIDVLSKTSNSVTFEITGNTENNTNIITVTYVPYYAVTINAGSGGSVSWSLVSGYVYGSSSGTVSAGQSQNVYVTWGTELQLTDNPNSGYAFTQWSFTGYVQPAQGYSSNSNPIEIVDTGGTGSVTANYQYTTYLKFTVSTTANSAIDFTITLSNGQSKSGNTLTQSTVTFYLPYGTYSWSISPTSVTFYSYNVKYVYVAVPSSGSATTNATVSINYVLSSATYQYTWSETGLPSGTQWGVSVNGNNYYTTSSSLTETFSTGQTYSWSVINPTDYSGSPATGSFSGPGSQTITFTQTSFQYTWYESGLPSGTKWGVQVNGQSYTTTGTSLTETFATGQTYTWSVINPSGYSGTPSIGSFSNSGSVTITFYKGLSVTAYANPTSGTQPLTVTYTASASGGSGSYFFSLYVDGNPVGNTVGPTSGSVTIQYTFQQAGTYSTYIQVQDANTEQTADSQTITITVNAPPNTYNLTFTETGLPTTNPVTGDAETWSVTVNGQTQSADAGQSITFTGLSGTVSWSVESPITVPVNRYHSVKYYANPSSGTASKGGTISITYSTSSSGGGGGSSTFTYTWYESGLSGQTWGVNVGGTSYTTSGSSLSETFTSGQTYSWSLIAPSGYVGNPSSGSFSGSGSSTITFEPKLSVSISASPTSGTAPLTVSFTSYVSGGTGSYSYFWTFGDGGTSTSANTTHTYNTPGTYTVQLTVKSGFQTAYSNTITIHVTSSTYSHTFTESGLPSYVSWSVTVNGQTKYAQAGQSITFTGLSGSVSWKANPVTVSTNFGHVTYYPNPSSGTISGSGTTSITYTDPPPMFTSYIFILFNFIERAINILYLVFQSALFDFQIFANVLHSASFLFLS
jgi:PKD repeat protein